MFIPDPTFFHPGSGSEFSIPYPGPQIYIKEFKYLNLNNCFLSSRKYDLGCSSRIRIPDLDPDFYPSGSRIQGSKRHRIPDPEHWFMQSYRPISVLFFSSWNCFPKTVKLRIRTRLSFVLLSYTRTARKIPLIYSFSGNSAASVLISTFICL
jgi:hypothetical protein